MPVLAKVGKKRRLAVQSAVISGLANFSPLAFAHGAERGLVMLLPAEHYITGAALAVASTFVLLSFISPQWVERVISASAGLFSLNSISPVIPSLVSFFILLFLVIAGFSGTHDPLLNPLPVFIWTLWWVIFTSIQFVTGDLWVYLNPWSGPTRIIRKYCRLEGNPAALPRRIGYFPAILLFAGFAWFELVYPAPEDPEKLATAVATYWLINMTAILVFGEKQWLERGEPFSIFYHLIGSMAPIQVSRKQETPAVVRLACPGAGLTALPALPMSGVLFVLLTLSSVSFDGLSGTFLWLEFIGVNPLEFPGRSAVAVSNTLGMLGALVILSVAFFGCVYLGCILSDQRDQFLEACGRLVYSIIPISLVFHAAHYLTRVLVTVQYTVPSFTDPFGIGWNSSVTENYHVTTSFLNNIDKVELIWKFQTTIIVLGHIIGIWVAHTIALRIFGHSRVTAYTQLFLAGFMVCYTIFGLWLLSTASMS
jgi:hypothetical protein